MKGQHRHTETSTIFNKIRKLEKSQLPEPLKYDNLKIIIKAAKDTTYYKHAIRGRIMISKARSTDELRKALLVAVREVEPKFNR